MVVKNYMLPVPNAKIHGVALRIDSENLTDLSGVYSAVGVFVDHGDNVRFPLVTVGKEDVTTIPALSTIYIYAQFHTPIYFEENCRVIVDTTSLPNTCKLTPRFLLEREE